MTLEHQVGVANRLNALTFQYGRAKRDGVSDADWTGLDADIDDLVGYMLFVDEAPLSGPVKGVSAFTLTFPQRGPRDRQGRSLRDFDLQKRIFRYPLSYIVYSDLFDGLPARISERVYRRLYDVLTVRQTAGKYGGLSAAERHALHRDSHRYEAEPARLLDEVPELWREVCLAIVKEAEDVQFMRGVWRSRRRHRLPSARYRGDGRHMLFTLSARHT